ncbi:MAG: GTPase HflX [Metallosphaera yellowstonensis]
MRAVLFASEDYLDEAMSLAESAGYDVIDIYKLPRKPNPSFYISKDKVDKLIERDNVEGVIIFDTLAPRHFINLNKLLFKKKIVDKVLLLLEIFALHAGSKEAKLQIELARLKHELPIIKDAYSRAKKSEQQGPLGAGVYGVESQIRLFSRKINRITKELEHVKKFREAQVVRTREEGIPYVAISGYTNAGKTSIFNALTNLRQATDSSMFTTTSPKRYLITHNKKRVMLVDTVGFIRGIPPQIIEAFFVTLSEIKYASALLMVFDISLEESMIVEMIRSSFAILRELGISGKPLLVVANKVDLLEGSYEEKLKLIRGLAEEYYNPVIDSILVSAKTLFNINTLRDKIFSLV